MPNPHPTYKIPKGTTPNPNGRPKREWTMTGLIEEALEKKDGETTVKEIIAEKLASLAKRGDMVAIKEINNRLDGMPTQKTELSGKDGSALRIEVVEDDKTEG